MRKQVTRPENKDIHHRPAAKSQANPLLDSRNHLLPRKNIRPKVARALDFEDLKLGLIVALDFMAESFGPGVVFLYRCEIIPVSVDDQQSCTRVAKQGLEGGGIVGAAECSEPGTRAKRVGQEDMGYLDV